MMITLVESILWSLFLVFMMVIVIIGSRNRPKCEEHIWRFAGSGLRDSLVPEWIFMCSGCKTKKWRAEGCYPSEESYNHFKELMGEQFKDHWRIVTSESENKTILIENLEKIKKGEYFNEG